MGPVETSLATMGTGQTLLAVIFVGSYALVLGRFAGTIGRRVAGLGALVAAVGFVALNDPWEAGVVMLAFAPVAMGLFAGVAWALWKVMPQSIQAVDRVVAPAPADVRPASVSVLQRLRAHLRFV